MMKNFGMARQYPTKKRYKKYMGNWMNTNIPLPEDFNKKKIIFKIFEDVEHEDSKGFERDMIIAYYYGIPLGYNLISCIPQKNIEKCVPDAKTYMRVCQGKIGDSYPPPSERTIKEYNGFLKYHVDKPITDFIRVYDPYKLNGIGKLLMHKGIEHSLEKFGCYFFSTLLIEGSGSEELFASIKKEYEIFKEKPDGYYSLKICEYVVK